MNRMSKEELLHVEAIGAEHGWVSPLTEEDKAYFAYLRTVFKRYSISPSKASPEEYGMVIRTAEREFYSLAANP